MQIDLDILDKLSYKTTLGKSLKNTLRKFDKESLFSEIGDYREFLLGQLSEVVFPYEYRIKALQSCFLKYNKYFPSKEVEKVFNDILGIRIVIPQYEIVDAMALPHQIRMVDMRYGKANDDGYRGIHMYFQKDHFHYPIELQLLTERDVQFSKWMHILTYKYVNNNNIPCQLRNLYDAGKINTLEDFRKELANVLLDSQKI